MRLQKKYLLLAGLFVFLFAGIAFASSSQFLPGGQIYIHDNCSKHHPTAINSIICYLFYKAQEQDAAINTINTTLTPIPSEINDLKNHQSQTDQSISTLKTTQANQGSQINSLQNTKVKALKVFDANNQELGILLTQTLGQVTVYNITADKFVLITSFDGQQSIGYQPLAMFTTSDCSGTPYIQGDMEDKFLLLVKGNYMQVDNSTAVQTLTIHSQTDNGICQPITNNNNFQKSNLRPLVASSNPYQNPVKIPLQFKYQ